MTQLARLRNKPCSRTKALLIQEQSNLPKGVIIQEAIHLGDGLAVGQAGFPSG